MLWQKNGLKTYIDLSASLVIMQENHGSLMLVVFMRWTTRDRQMCYVGEEWLIIQACY